MHAVVANNCTEALVYMFISALVFDFVMYLYITNCDGKITTANASMFMCVCFSGALIKGEHSKTGPKTQLHPRQLHGGGHG